MKGIIAEGELTIASAAAYQSSVMCNSKSAQTVPTVGDMEKFEEQVCEQCRGLQEDNQELKAEKVALKVKVVSLEISEQFFKSNDDKVQFYTGIANWNLLVLVIQFVQPFLNVHGRSSLSAFQQLIMTLMRLRLVSQGRI